MAAFAGWRDRLIVLLAGLPGTGKSTLARAVAPLIDGVILNKDTVRAALFPERCIEYTAEQDDFCMKLMLEVAEYLLARNPALTVLLDGRTFSRAYQREAVREAASRMATPFRAVECVCPEETARERLERDEREGLHPAKNRSFELYLSVKGLFEAVEEPKLVVDTEQPLQANALAVIEWLRAR